MLIIKFGVLLQRLPRMEQHIFRSRMGATDFIPNLLGLLVLRKCKICAGEANYVLVDVALWLLRIRRWAVPLYIHSFHAERGWHRVRAQAPAIVLNSHSIAAFGCLAQEGCRATLSEVLTSLTMAAEPRHESSCACNLHESEALPWTRVSIELPRLLCSCLRIWLSNRLACGGRGSWLAGTKPCF